MLWNSFLKEILWHLDIKQLNRNNFIKNKVSTYYLLVTINNIMLRMNTLSYRFLVWGKYHNFLFSNFFKLSMAQNLQGTNILKIYNFIYLNDLILNMIT